MTNTESLKVTFKAKKEHAHSRLSAMLIRHPNHRLAHRELLSNIISEDTTGAGENISQIVNADIFDIVLEQIRNEDTNIVKQDFALDVITACLISNYHESAYNLVSLIITGELTCVINEDDFKNLYGFIDTDSFDKVTSAFITKICDSISRQLENGADINA